ncbi:hypothetical protein [Streptomyces avermitilis]|uniref:hypothetical protein n=1 Tax=Streptomyces avermitilis TaxID=33903 RepID=UPI0033C883D3
MRAGLLERLPVAQRERLRCSPPDGRAVDRPMLSVLSDRRTFGGGWLFERKLDGERASLRSHDRVQPGSLAVLQTFSAGAGCPASL